MSFSSVDSSVSITQELSTMDIERVGVSISSLPQEIVDHIIECAAQISPPLYERYTGEESDSGEEDEPPPTTQRTLAVVSRLSIRFRTTSQRLLLRHVALTSLEQTIKWANDAPTYPTISLEFNDWFKIDPSFPRDLVAKRCKGLKRLVLAVKSEPGGIDEDWLRSPELSELTSIDFLSPIPPGFVSEQNDFPFRLQSLKFSDYASRLLSSNIPRQICESAGTSLRRLQCNDGFRSDSSVYSIGLPLVRANLVEIRLVTSMSEGFNFEFEHFPAVTHLTLITYDVDRHLLQVVALPALTHLSLQIPDFALLALLPEPGQQFLRRLKEIRFVNQTKSTVESKNLVVKFGLEGVSIVYGPRSDGSFWCTK